jgi:hypothetical protein
MEPTASSPAMPADAAKASQQETEKIEAAYGQLFFQIMQQTMNAAKREADDQ